MKHFKYRSHIFLMFCFLFFTVLLIFPKTVSAALKISKLETVPWNMMTESSIINETAKQFFEIRLWTHKEISEEFLRYYDQMDDEKKELIPLKKIWVVNGNDN